MGQYLKTFPIKNLYYIKEGVKDMPAKINLLNQTFGKLLVIEETDKRKNKSVVWKCQCECGNIEEFSSHQLRSDGIIQCKTCGTVRKPNHGLTKNIVGEKFNHLTVLEKTSQTQGGKILYKCQCDCLESNIVFVNRTDLISGHTKSCGCIRRKFQIGDTINNRKILKIVPSRGEQTGARYLCECLFCNNIYEASSTTIQKTISCGCQKSIGEFNIMQILKKNNIPFIKEYCIQQYRYDFAITDQNKNIIRLIEFDGEQHYEQNIKNSGWNTYEKYQYTLQNDLTKNQIAKDLNIPLARIPYWERDNISIELLFNEKYLIL